MKNSIHKIRKNNKFLRDSFNKGRTKLLYTENYKTLPWDVKENLPKWKDTPYFWIANQYLIISWRQLLSKSILDLTYPTSKSQLFCFCFCLQKLTSWFLDLVNNYKGPRIAKTTLKKKNKIVGLIPSNLKITIILQ